VVDVRGQFGDRGTSAAETSDVLSAADGLDLFIDGWYVVV
jgi:hypothetical protein